jgi:hypothetical protein
VILLDLLEMLLEVTCGRRYIVPPLPVARNAVLYLDASDEFGVKKIAFVEEDNQLSCREELARAQRTPKQVAVFQTVDSTIFCELLVKARDWGKEDNGVRIIEVWVPSCTLEWVG